MSSSRMSRATSHPSTTLESAAGDHARKDNT